MIDDKAFQPVQLRIRREGKEDEIIKLPRGYAEIIAEQARREGATTNIRAVPRRRPRTA